MAAGLQTLSRWNGNKGHRHSTWLASLDPLHLVSHKCQKLSKSLRETLACSLIEVDKLGDLVPEYRPNLGSWKPLVYLLARSSALSVEEGRSKQVGPFENRSGNCRLRHYLARLHRKTLRYSKSKTMLEVSLKLLIHKPNNS